MSTKGLFSSWDFPDSGFKTPITWTMILQCKTEQDFDKSHESAYIQLFGNKLNNLD